ncbi:Putative ribonuclease H protein At1g65750 [Linum perenne]
MQSKLAGWKRNTLSLAGWITLAQSVLNAIPTYAMQSSSLPQHTTSRIDSNIRNFIWGASSDHKKPHLLSWDSICRPKEQGGLGLRKAREMNDAYLMKLGWTILKEPDRLWVQIFTDKYLKETSEGLQIRRKTGGSSLWKGIRRTWHDLVSGCQHSIRNGKDTSFWNSTWLDSGVRLIDHATRSITEVELNNSVSDWVDDTGKWDWQRLNGCLPPLIVGQVTGMDSPHPTDGDDEMIWGPDPKGRFSIKSAYEILATTRGPPQQNTWKHIWRWQGPSRIKHFLWLAAHNRLLSNEERLRRHMTDRDDCHRCPSVSETSLHILRDCNLAKSVWTSLLPPDHVANFFVGDIHDWIVRGIQLFNDNLLFGVTTWILWKARNEDIFDNKRVTSDQLRLRVLHWIAGVRETMRAESHVLSEVVTRRRETLLRWIPDPDQWVTVNCDCSVIQPHGLAACGGIIRNSHGRRLAVFAANLGVCTIMRAELRAVVLGLELAWEMGMRKIQLQIDSQSSVLAIMRDHTDDSRHGHTIQHIRRLLSRDWLVDVSHIF